MKEYYIWLIRCFGAANPKIHELIENTGSAKNAYEAVTNNEVEIPAEILSPYYDKTTLDDAFKLITYCEKHSIGLLSIDDKEYPFLLKQIYNPPVLLFYRGDISCLKRPCLTMVGARQMTLDTEVICKSICEDLISEGITLVSGMAKGTDQCIHNCCIEAKAPTVGVLACGMNIEYPWGSMKLRESICECGGAYLSELFPHEGTSSVYFRARNRILSGLSYATAVMQAGKQSGSLITANYAVEQSRDVFCVPPPDIYDPAYAGVVGLLEDGAYPLFDHEDILEQYSLYLNLNNE